MTVKRMSCLAPAQAIDELLAAEFLHATRCRALGPAVECALGELHDLARYPALHLPLLPRSKRSG